MNGIPDCYEKNQLAYTRDLGTHRFRCFLAAAQQADRARRSHRHHLVSGLVLLALVLSYPLAANRRALEYLPEGAVDRGASFALIDYLTQREVQLITLARPYRPALGLNKALEEITKNKGKLYDSETADACLRLFAEGRFEFER